MTVVRPLSGGVTGLTCAWRRAYHAQMAATSAQTARGALAGAIAAGIWVAQQPFDKAVFGVEYDDAGVDHYCAVSGDGSLRCWGNDGSGQATPVSGSDYVSVTAGSEHACALHASGLAPRSIEEVRLVRDHLDAQRGQLPLAPPARRRALPVGSAGREKPARAPEPAADAHDRTDEPGAERRAGGGVSRARP